MERYSIAPYMAAFLTARCGLENEACSLFHETIRRLIEALREGHSCLPLGDQERSVLAASRLVSMGDLAPLVLSGNRLYLHRGYQQEVMLAENLKALATAQLADRCCDELLERFFPAHDDGPDWQKEAARNVLSGRLTIIAGGPGTGKTTTVARIVGVLLACYGPRHAVMMAAPTGKAAIRLIEAVQSHLPRLPLSEDDKRRFPDSAQTVHRLLGISHTAGTLRYSRENPLPADTVVVDEASMVDLALMGKLVEALAPDSRLILLGDKDQLASVESGAVLSDCIRGLPQRVVELRRSWRFDQGIARFATAVNDGDAEQAWQIMHEPDGAVIPAAADWRETVGFQYHRFLSEATKSGSEAAYADLFVQFNRFRVLTALRHGPCGAAGINDWVEWYLARQGCVTSGRRWYPGRPVIITRNDYSLGLSNGDIGFCLPIPGNEKELAVWFEQPGMQLRRFATTQLPSCETAWAMTIHKSQGSEFDEVTVVLPDAANQILCRELLYTAVTRARQRVTLVVDRDALRAAVLKRTRRCSGLAERLQIPGAGRQHDRVYP